MEPETKREKEGELMAWEHFIEKSDLICKRTVHEILLILWNQEEWNWRDK